MIGSKLARQGCTEITGWRSTGNSEQYESNGKFNNGNGRFYPKHDGYYLCCSNIRLDRFPDPYARPIIAANGEKHYNNGLHTIEGNWTFTDYHSLQVPGTLRLRKGQWASALTYKQDFYHAMASPPANPAWTTATLLHDAFTSLVGLSYFVLAGLITTHLHF